MPIKHFSVAHMRPLKIVGIFANFFVLQDPALNVVKYYWLKKLGFFHPVSWKVGEVRKESAGDAYTNGLVVE